MRVLLSAVFCVFTSCLLIQLSAPALYANDVQGIINDKVNSVLSRWDNLKCNGRNGPRKLPSVREKWAILIGADRYQDSSIGGLPYARNSVLLLDRSLKSQNNGHFHPGHITALTGVNATRERIYESLLGPALIHKALPSDLIVVYFAARMLPSQSGDDLFLCTYDTLASEVASSGISLSDILSKLKKHTGCPQIVCILDCSPVSNQLPPDKWGKDKINGFSLDGLAKKTGVSFVAASDPGVESLSWTPSHFSYFSEFLAEGLKATDGNIPLAGLVSYIQENINNECQENHLSPTKVSLLVALDAPDMGHVVLGEQKHGINAQNVRFGYNVRNLCITHPELMSTRQPSSTKVAQNQRANGKSPTDDGVESRFGETDIDPYMDKMRRDIRAKWNLPKGLENCRVVAIFSILQDGSIVNPRIAEGSGVSEADKIALEALKAASPLDRLPPGTAPSVQVRYVFDSRIASQ